MEYKFASRMERMKASEIRELLKLTARPDIISFAGGLPAPELFPVKEIAQVSHDLVLKEGQKLLQYATTEGRPTLREKIAKRMTEKYGTPVDMNDILITTGSQQCLDFAGKLFLDPGDVVLCESPSYLGALNAFNAYQPVFKEVPTDGEGIIPEELDKILATTPKCKFIYVIPDFQNPTGICWSLERRKKFMEVINKYDLPVFEDNPYGELRYSGESFPTLKSMDTKGLVSFLGTFSKIFCPGLRLGWIAFILAILLLVVCGVTVNSGERMAPAFHDRDIVVFYRLAKDISAGEVVVFRGENDRLLVGRVVAKGGDTVDIDENGLKINGYYQTEPYRRGDTVLFEGGAAFPVKLRTGEFFILCDDRSDGSDSRTFGPVSSDRILGRVMLSIRQRDF